MKSSTSPSFDRDLSDSLAAISACIESRQHMPAKILTYALIDSLAWAASDKQPKEARKNFEAWVSRWLAPELTKIGNEISAVDLYAGRCAVLHTMTPNSELANSGRARTIAYAWGSAKVEALDYAFKAKGLRGVAAIHYDDLYSALKTAVATFLTDAAADKALAARVSEAASQHYVYINNSRPTEE